ncbi:uncharacterized protein LOC128984454 [Macrosteles quadrilineatus]|uniref:uncharacterized protein LOC128984454 n=1 Tax=Macrosteles quadrilineatus TaxID=74068 RepID=UPI0023E0FD9D|nr:uncharacterized protein LOC128984454 [Macrosteles quadrilineatus]
MTDTDIDTALKSLNLIPDNLLLLPPAVSHLIKNQDDIEVLRETCNGIKLNKYDFVACVVNGRQNEADEGGNHWSLLVTKKQESQNHKDISYHWDSAGGINTSEAKRLAAKLSNFMSNRNDDVGNGNKRSDEVHLVNVPCRQQSGGVECGAYAVHNAELEDQLQRRFVAAGDYVVIVGGTNNTSPAHYAQVMDRLREQRETLARMHNSRQFYLHRQHHKETAMRLQDVTKILCVFKIQVSVKCLRVHQCPRL